VHIRLNLPPDLEPELRAQLTESEARRGRELRDAGTIVRIWRIPGQMANVGIWEASGPTTLHDAIASLPMFPFLHAEVTPLATHYLEA
jgi:muconolactone D-isomerase